MVAPGYLASVVAILAGIGLIVAGKTVWTANHYGTIIGAIVTAVGVGIGMGVGGVRNWVALVGVRLVIAVGLIFVATWNFMGSGSWGI